MGERQNQRWPWGASPGPMERKSVPFEVDEKDGVNVEERRIKGYFAVFGNFDGKDIIDKGACKKTLREQGHRIKSFWIHDFHEPIGKPDELKEVPRSKLPQKLLDRAPDATGGLYADLKISRTRRGDEALILAKDGVLDEGSIGFDTMKEEWLEHEDGGEVRHIKELRLFDVSPVPIAMNPAAIITDVKEFAPEEGKPYPNEHACRLEDPKKYDTCRRGKRVANEPESVKGKEFVVIYCKKGDGPMEQQAFRYPIKTWTAAEAGAHCKHNKGSFEAAAEEEGKDQEVEAEQLEALKKAELQAAIQRAEIQRQEIEAAA